MTITEKLRFFLAETMGWLALLLCLVGWHDPVTNRSVQKLCCVRCGALWDGSGIRKD